MIIHLILALVIITIAYLIEFFFILKKDISKIMKSNHLLGKKEQINNKKSLSQIRKEEHKKRVVKNEPCYTKYKDFRFIVNDVVLENEIIDFPIELDCSLVDRVKIMNCEFKDDILIIRVKNSIKSVYIYNSKIKELKIYGTDTIEEEVSLDCCVIEKIEISGILTERIEIYKVKTDEIYIQENIVNEFYIDNSNIGVLLNAGNKVKNIYISPRSFKKKGLTPFKLFKTLYKRNVNKDFIYPENYTQLGIISKIFSMPSVLKTTIKYRKITKKQVKESTLKSLDFLIKNQNISLSTSEISDLLYCRNQIQSSIFNKWLWFFGYFQRPTNYIATAILFYILLFTLLNIVVYFGNLKYNTFDLIRFSTDSLIGLSNTIGSEDNKNFMSILLSISIGFGTVLYSGLLVTLINRFRIKS